MMKHRLTRSIALPLLAAPLLLGACDDPFAAEAWDATPDTLTLYSASRAEHTGLNSALDLWNIATVPIEVQGATGQWDFLLTEQAGVLSLVSASVVPNLDSRAGIVATDATTLEELTRATGESSAYVRTPVTLRAGAVYVARSRRLSCGFVSGSRYGKLKVTSLDSERGIVELAVVRNPYCDDRDLIPPDDD
jgi:hypothetical protein